MHNTALKNNKETGQLKLWWHEIYVHPVTDSGQKIGYWQWLCIIQSDCWLFTTRNYRIQVKNTLGWSAVVSCACILILLFFVVFCSVIVFLVFILYKQTLHEKVFSFSFCFLWTVGASFIAGQSGLGIQQALSFGSRVIWFVCSDAGNEQQFIVTWNVWFLVVFHVPTIQWLNQIQSILCNSIQMLKLFS
jgi:hypothetical protein